MSFGIEFHTIGPLYPTLLPQEVFEPQIIVILIITVTNSELRPQAA